MTTNVDIEDIASTKSEKFLAVVLAAFLLVGSIWFYVKVDDWLGGRAWQYTAAEQAVMDARDDAWEKQQSVDAVVETEKTEVQLAKDALDIALAKGEPSTAAEARYDRELAQFESARKDAAAANAEVRAAEQKAAAVDRRHQARADDPGRQWAIAALRLGFIALWLGASFRLLSSLRKRQSRFLPLGFAAVATGVVTALVFATDYITDYIDPLDLGPIVLSLVGAAATIAAFVGLQRWLAARIPGRRVRSGECPFCGHPVRGDGPHCEGCGREVVAACGSCGEPRRVGSPHCATCGKT